VGESKYFVSNCRACLKEKILYMGDILAGRKSRIYMYQPGIGASGR